MGRLTRAERRQLLKDDAPFIGRPLALADIARGACANTRHMIAILGDASQKRRATRLAVFAGQLADVTLTAQAPPSVDCAKGCDHCCKTWVSASIPEVFRVAHAVRRKQDTRARIEAAAIKCRVVPQHEREVNRIRCPILADGACSEYTDRPLACRTVLSTSVATCRRIFNDNQPEIFPHAYNTVLVRSHVMIMMRTALRLSGLSHHNYDFHHAVDVALADERAEERWLHGEAVFESVAVDSAEADMPSMAQFVAWLTAAVQPTI